MSYVPSDSDFSFARRSSFEEYVDTLTLIPDSSSNAFIEDSETYSVQTNTFKDPAEAAELLECFQWSEEEFDIVKQKMKERKEIIKKEMGISDRT